VEPLTFRCKCLIVRMLSIEVRMARGGDSDSMAYLLSGDAELWAKLVGMDKWEWAEKVCRVMREWGERRTQAQGKHRCRERTRLG
jgi:hypothetical protein